MGREDEPSSIIRSALADWFDFLPQSQRKVIARRRANRRMLPAEVAAMNVAQEMLLDGQISILTRIEPQSFGSGHIVTYIAERVK